MADDIKGVIRTVAGFQKEPDADGQHPLIVEYKLKPVALSFLRKVFDIPENHPSPIFRDLIDCHVIAEKHAKLLQPYVIDGEIDLDKYDFMLECSKAPDSE